ncbi:lysine--tRNA ligase [Candidatus Nardonella dryophthoridicola]|uniref:lysine--tRNA ligase n=1 Tax=Candidatus Nardonella dryophthoridicola TaxID=1971485 RepID=UPI002A4E1DD3|nr:lysine--tRNA ligase [Candidatus Nardonella dryophthoridicola]
MFFNKFKINIYLNELVKKYNNFSKNELENINFYIKTAGRIIYKRIIGKLTFLIIKELNELLQIYISFSDIENKYYIYQKKYINIGDIIGVEGNLFRTKNNVLSIKCKKILVLSKSYKFMPDKYHGISNYEVSYKKRYLDLIYNNSISTFIIRSKIINEIRNFLIKKKFIEVETPILQNIPGGANAKPFITKTNLSNKNIYLRISPELYLKKLLIGGFNKIFEINKNFRNEGISKFHNPEFSMIEIYITYVKYEYLIKLIQNLFKYISKKIFNKYIIYYDNIEINFNNSFEIYTMKESISKYNNIDIKKLNNINECIKILNKLNIKVINNNNINNIHLEIFKKTVEKKLIYPTFITEYPIEDSPLSKRNDKKQNIADRFELFINGSEIGNGFSELNDPYDQSLRFLKQFNEDNNKKYNFDYIDALEYGLPPCAGLGLGIDRIVMLFTNKKSIRDVILFPNIHYK